MLAQATQSSLTFGSPFGSFGTGVMFCLAVASVAWMILRERRVLGAFWQVVFLGTRAAALLAIFWMLLQPARVKESTDLTPQSVAILVDRSPSMDVADSLATPEMFAWKTFVDKGESTQELTTIEEALLHTGSLKRLCGEVLQSLLHQAGPETIARLVDTLVAQVERTGELLDGLKMLEGDTTTSELASEILSTFHGPIDGFVGHELDSLASDDPSQMATLVAEFDEFALDVQGVHDQLRRLRRSYLQFQIEAMPSSADQISFGPTRRELISSLMEGLETSTLAQLPEHVQLLRLSFDEAPIHLFEPVSWTQSLLNRQTGDAASPFRTISFSMQNENNEDGETIQTDLTAAMESLQREMLTRRFRFALLVSDGRHNHDNKQLPADLAKQLDGLPIYTVPIGNSASRRDAILHRVSAPTTVVQGDQAVIRAIVSVYECVGETLAVHLIKHGQIVQTQTFDVETAEMDHRVSFQVPTETLGRSEYEIQIEPVSDEVTTKNNAVAVAVEVVRDKLRILLADNYPRWEFRYLQQLFRRDEHVEHDEALFQPRVQLTGELAGWGGLPRSLEDWSKYDVVILGDLTLDQLNIDQQMQLTSYVTDRGGKVVLISGSEQMPQMFADLPLGRLLPVTRGPTRLMPNSSYAVELTAEGDTHPAMQIADSLAQSRQLWHQIYTKIPLTSLSSFQQLKPSARSLADVKILPSGQTSVEASELANMVSVGSFLSWHRVGNGHVVFLASPSSYTLRFRQGDRGHHRFWGQLLRWLTAADLSSGTELVRMQTDKTRYVRGEEVTVTLRLRDASGQPVRSADAQVQARSDEDVIASIPLQEDEKVPGLYRAVFETLRPGVYHIEPEGELVRSLLSQQEAGSPPVTSLIAIEELLNTEMIQTELNLPLLEQISASTGGQVISPLAISELFRMTNFEPDVSTHVETIPLWNRWPLLWLVAGCLCFEWLVRKQKGLL